MNLFIEGIQGTGKSTLTNLPGDSAVVLPAKRYDPEKVRKTIFPF